MPRQRAGLPAVLKTLPWPLFLDMLMRIDRSTILKR